MVVFVMDGLGLFRCIVGVVDRMGCFDIDVDEDNFVDDGLPLILLLFG